MSQIDPSGSTQYAAQLGTQAIYGLTFTPTLAVVIAQNPQDDLLQYATPGGVFTVYQTNQYDTANHVIIAPPLTEWPTPNYAASISATSVTMPPPTTVMVPIVGVADPTTPIVIVATPEPSYAGILAILAMIAIWSLNKARWFE